MSGSFFEVLERRVLLSGVVRELSGTVFYDANNDGDLSPGEAGVSGATIYVDVNASQKFDDGDTSTTSDAQGHYQLMTDAFTMQLQLARPAGWVGTGAKFRDLMPNVLNFAMGKAPIITGTVFADADADYFKAGGLTPRAGVTLYLDRNENGLADEGEETAVSDASGKYRFSDIEIGRLLVRPAPLAGWSQEGPQEPWVVGAGEKDQQAVYTYRSRTISGTIFKDLDRDGVRDAGEGGLRKAVITATWGQTYGDGSRVVVMRSGFLQGQVTETQADGSFVLNDVPIISKQLVINIEEWYLSTAANPTGNELEIGLAHPSDISSDPTGTVRGMVYNDLNHNGSMDPGEPPMVGAHVSLVDAPSQGQVADVMTDENGVYEITGISRGRYRVGSGSDDAVLWRGRSETVYIFEGETEKVDLWASYFARVSGQVLVRNGGNVSYWGQVITYLDFNNNGKRDDDEPEDIGQAWSQRDGNGHILSAGWDYEIETIKGGEYTVRLEKVPKPLRLIGELPAGDGELGKSYEHEPIDVEAPVFRARATVFFDKNGNGSLDAREPLLQKVAVLVDKNFNGIQDDDEESYSTDNVGKFAAMLPYGPTRLKVTIPARYRRLGLVSRGYTIRVLSSKSAAHLMIGLGARK